MQVRRSSTRCRMSSWPIWTLPCLYQQEASYEDFGGRVTSRRITVVSPKRKGPHVSREPVVGHASTFLYSGDIAPGVPVPRSVRKERSMLHDSKNAAVTQSR